MTDRATANLPSSDFQRTADFYTALGFGVVYRDESWMILERGTLFLEFFHHPAVDPLTSWFSACFRIDDLDAFYAMAKDVPVPEKREGQPRLRPPRIEAWGGRVAALIDPDGTLIRLIQN